jgi:hypothetical protein
MRLDGERRDDERRRTTRLTTRLGIKAERRKFARATRRNSEAMMLEELHGAKTPENSTATRAQGNTRAQENSRRVTARDGASAERAHERAHDRKELDRPGEIGGAVNRNPSRGHSCVQGYPGELAMEDLGRHGQIGS